MINRRAFLTFLAGLPIVGKWVANPAKPKYWEGTRVPFKSKFTLATGARSREAMKPNFELAHPAVTRAEFGDFEREFDRIETMGLAGIRKARAEVDQIIVDEFKVF